MNQQTRRYKGGSFPLAGASSVASLPAGASATPTAGDTPATPPTSLKNQNELQKSLNIPE